MSRQQPPSIRVSPDNDLLVGVDFLNCRKSSILLCQLVGSSAYLKANLRGCPSRAVYLPAAAGVAENKTGSRREQMKPSVTH